jgi:hypothetical protein
MNELLTKILEAHGGLDRWNKLERVDATIVSHDYQVDIAGGFGAAQLTTDYVTANGIRLPTKRRAYMRRPDRRPIVEMLLVSIDISEIRYE